MKQKGAVAPSTLTLNIRTSKPPNTILCKIGFFSAHIPKPSSKKRTRGCFGYYDKETNEYYFYLYHNKCLFKKKRIGYIQFRIIYGDLSFEKLNISSAIKIWHNSEVC